MLRITAKSFAIVMAVSLLLGMLVLPVLAKETAKSQAKVNLNTATEDQLIALPGVGAATANHNDLFLNLVFQLGGNMGLFDDMLQKATDWTSGSTDEHARLAHSVLEMVSSERSGGIPALVQSCKDHGLSDVINSWIGVGQNMPISAENVDRVLGNEKVKALAAKAGISPEEARNKLAEVLPLVVDKLTPDGKVPDASTLVAAAENFMKKRGGNIPS